MITSNRLINDLLILRDAIVHADKEVAPGPILAREGGCENLIVKIESMILRELEGEDKKAMEIFFKIDI